MVPPEDAPQTESKLKQFGDAVLDGVITQAVELAVDAASGAVAGAADLLSSAGQLTADCGSAAVDVVCQAAGSALDGV